MAMLMMVVSVKANKAAVTDIVFECCDIYICVYEFVYSRENQAII